jgi:hypothetical protein
MYLEDDDGEDSDLVGFYSDDYKSLPKDTLRKLGYKMAANEAGELEVVKRWAAQAAGSSATGADMASSSGRQPAATGAGTQAAEVLQGLRAVDT